MKVKIKGVCVDINKPRTQKDLNRLLNVCKSEASTALGTRKSFIQMTIDMLEEKLIKEYYSITKTITNEEKQLELS